jgi:general secretion pathway protein L
VVARGEGVPAPAGEAAEPPLVVVPAEAVTLHWAELPDRSAAQAVAAARLLAADASAAPIAELHVAVGREAGQVERPIGIVSIAQMRAWLSTLADHDIDPAALVPAAMLLPRPDADYVRADLGGAWVVRGATSAFADEPRLTELVTGGKAPTTLGRDELEAAIIAAVTSPPLDLRQGIFGRRSRVAIDWKLIRRLAWLVVGILGVTLLISLVQIARYSFAADSLERQADLLARQGLPPGETVNNADRQLDARLNALRGGGAGFSRTAAAVFAAVRSVPGAELRAVAFDANGEMRVTVAGENEGQMADLRSRIEAYGFSVRPGVFQTASGRVSGDMTVNPR